MMVVTHLFLLRDILVQLDTPIGLMELMLLKDYPRNVYVVKIYIVTKSTMKTHSGKHIPEEVSYPGKEEINVITFRI